jgi:MFS family permease
MTKGAKILLMGGGIWYFVEGMFGPLVAVFTDQVGGDIFNISWTWATYLFVYGVLSIVIGYYSDRYFDKKTLMVFGYGLNTIFTFGYLLVNDPLSLLIVQAGLGVAAALATPTWNALFDELTPNNSGGLAWGVSDGIANIITAVSIFIGAIIVTYFGFHVLFITMGIIQLFATIYQAKILYLDKNGKLDK